MCSLSSSNAFAATSCSPAVQAAQDGVALSRKILQDCGVRAEVLGKVVEGKFRPESTLEFLILDPAGLAEVQIFDLIRDNLRELPFGLHLRPQPQKGWLCA